MPGKGRFRKAPADILALALAAIEKKKQIVLQIKARVKDLSEGTCLLPVRDQLYKILFKPDKNTPWLTAPPKRWVALMTELSTLLTESR